MGDINYIDIGNRITELRNEKGLTQEQLAEKLDVSRAALSSWENGKKEISLESLLKLCKFFDVDAEYLVNGIDFEGYKSYKKQIAGAYTRLSPVAIDNIRKINDFTVDQYEMILLEKENDTNIPPVKHSSSLFNYILTNHIDVIVELLKDMESMLCAYANYKTEHLGSFDESEDESNYYWQLLKFQRKYTDFIESIDYPRFEYETFYKYDYPDARPYTLEEYREKFYTKSYTYRQNEDYEAMVLSELNNIPF